MKIKFLILPILLSSIFVLLVSCLHTSNKKLKVDIFYTEKGDGDMGRIPLLKPYEAVIATKDYGWCISLHGKYSGIGFCNIKKVAVLDTVLLVSTGNTILNGADVKESWHIIIPKNDFDKGFDNYRDYIAYLNTLGMKTEPMLYNIDSVASYFNDHDVIDWKAIINLSSL